MKCSKRICAMLLMLVMLLSAMPFAVLNASASLNVAGEPTDLTYYAKGIDISYWQAGDTSGSNVNFEKLKASGCEFVILRLAYGQSMDKAFLSFYNKARAAGMPLGVYIYGLKTTYSGAASDAQWAINVFEEYDMYFEYPIFYDIEEADQIALSSANATALCEGWCDTLEAAGYFPGIYAGKQFYAKLTSSFKEENDLWIAHVASTDVTATQFNYKSKDYNAQGYSMWQYAWSNLSGGSYIYDGVYSSGTTKVKDLDIDVCYKNYPEIMKTYGYNNCGSDAKAQLWSSIEKAKTLRYTNYGASQLANLRQVFNTAVSVYYDTASGDSAYKTAKTELDNAMNASNTVISKGCSYTTSVSSRDDMPDEGGVTLTDGVKAQLECSIDPNRESGPYAGFNAHGDFTVTVDLGSAKSSNIFTIYVASDFYGIPVPNDLTISCSSSADGEFTSVNGNLTVTKLHNGELVDGMEQSNIHAMTFASNSMVNARYIRFNININNYVWLDEVEISSGETPLSGHVYVSGYNRRVGAGDCIVFNPDFGEISATTANHCFTNNVIAKWNEAEYGYVVTRVYEGSGTNEASVTLAADEIFIAAHNWETGVTDGTAVAGSAINSRTLGELQVGDVIRLNGIDAYNSEVLAAPYVEKAGENGGAAVPDPDPDPDPDHEHTPGTVESCAKAQICIDCGEILAEATGHIEGDWEQVEGMYVKRCTVCGYVLEARKYVNGESIVGDGAVGLRGDVNENGGIDARDYVALKRYYFKTANLSETALLLADVNEDGEVNARDYVSLKRAYFKTYKIKNPYVYN